MPGGTDDAPSVFPNWDTGRGGPNRPAVNRPDNHRWWLLMRDVQRIAIVDPNDNTREDLRNVLLGLESIWLEAECSRYEFFYDVIQQSSPHVVMISLDNDQN